jgi:hypothetical protein
MVARTHVGGTASHLDGIDRGTATIAAPVSAASSKTL